MSSNYYVYILKNPMKNNEIFYIGKGKNNRFKYHWKQFKSSKFNNHLYNTITQIKKAGYDLYNYEIINCLNEQEAHQKEKELIKFYGKCCDKTGTLVNISDGGAGGGAHGYKKVKQYNIFREYIKTHNSILEASKAVGLYNSSSIVCCCKKSKKERMAKGFIWCYENEEPDWEWINFYIKPIYQWTKDGKLINRFENRRSFEKETGFYGGNINNYINNQLKGKGTCSLPYGFVFTRTSKFIYPIMRQFPRDKRIMCLETGEIFINSIEAAKKYNPNFNKNKNPNNMSKSIRNCALGKTKKTYGFKWKYV